MTPEQAKQLTDWLIKNADRISYGEITLTIVKHDNQVRSVEKVIREREKVS